MKQKARQQAQRIVIYALVFIFIAGTFLLYLPLGQSTPQPSPEALPLDQVPQGGQVPTEAEPAPNQAPGGNVAPAADPNAAPAAPNAGAPGAAQPVPVGP